MTIIAMLITAKRWLVSLAFNPRVVTISKREVSSIYPLHCLVASLDLILLTEINSNGSWYILFQSFACNCMSLLF